MPNHESSLTIEDAALFPDDGRRHEIVDGAHVVTPAPTLRHQWICGEVFAALRQAARETGAGEVFFAPADVVLSPTDLVQPDVFLVRRDHLGRLGDRLEGAPDLAVEVVSPSSRRTDELLKRRAYERCGVEELWVVDPELEVVRVYRREAGAFARPVELAAERGDALETSLLPGLHLELASLFAPLA